MLNQLTFTRFIAALAIVFFHFGVGMLPLNNSIINPLVANANIGVSYFFILSGFVMVIAYGNKRQKIDKKEYYLNRIARIYPVYIAALILMSIILYLADHIFDIKGFFFSALLLQAWLPSHALSINSPGWSLSVEFLFYFLFPFLINNFYKHYNLKRIALIIGIVWIISQIIFHLFLNSSFYHGHPSNSHNILFYFPLMHINQFLLGNLAGCIFIKFPKKANYDLYLVVISILLPVIILAKHYYNLKIDFHNGLMGFYFISFIFIFAKNNGKLTTFFSKKVFVTLGEISFSLYILQMPIYYLVHFAAKTIKITQPLVLFYGFLLILIVCSYISYYIIEVPARNLIKNMYAKTKRVKASYNTK